VGKICIACYVGDYFSQGVMVIHLSVLEGPFSLSSCFCRKCSGIPWECMPYFLWI